MKLILKLTLANIKKSKLRTFMIIFSILLSTSLIYAILGVNKSVETIFEKQIKKETGTAELFVSSAVLNSKGINETFLESEYFEYARGVIKIHGYANNLKDEKQRLNIHGYSYDDLEIIHSISMIERNNDELFSGLQVIIGKNVADYYGLSINQIIEISINEEIYEAKIWGIGTDDNNILTEQLDRINIILPVDYLQEILNLDKNYFVYYLKTNSEVSISEAKSYLLNTYPDYKVQTINADNIQVMMEMITIPLLILVMIVIIISTFIIYSAFKVIAIERLPVIGTLRSIGSTKKTTSITLLVESLFLGLIGGILGIMLGGFVLIFITKNIASNGQVSANIDLNYDLVNMLITLSCALFLSLASAVIPILRTINISIKDIITNTINNNDQFKFYKVLVGIVLIIVAFVFFEYSPKNLALQLSLIGFISLPIGVTLIMPLVIKVFCQIFTFFKKIFLKDEATLALSNIKHDKVIHSNIVLLGIGLGVILLVNTLVHTIMYEVMDVYNRAHYDIIIDRSYESEEFEDKLSKIEGIKYIYKVYEKFGVEVTNKDLHLAYVYGIDEEYFDKSWDVEVGKNKEQIFQKLSDEDTIILTKTIADNNNINIGDRLNLIFGDTERNYEVIAVVDTLVQNGQIGFVDKNNFKNVTKPDSLDYYLGTTKDPFEVKESIKTKFSSEEFFIHTVGELQEMNIKNNNTIFVLMKGVSMIAMIIGVVGILNNYMISYLSRKRILAVFRSIGLSNTKMIRMLFLESFFGGLIGSLSAVAIGVLFLQTLRYVFSIMNIPNMLRYSPSEIIITLVSGIFISVVAALMPIFKINKMSIVENLKYE
jgi:putative ABC transport system permease protein